MSIERDDVTLTHDTGMLLTVVCLHTPSPTAITLEDNTIYTEK